MTDKDSYCRDIHASLDIRFLNNNTTRVRPCCIANVHEIFNGGPFNTLFSDLRKLNRADKLDTTACSECIHDEKLQRQSRRESVNMLWDEHHYDISGPESIDITLDHTCNSACMICSPADSSFWKRYADVQPKATISNNFLQVQTMLDNLDLSHLKKIQFRGGEPFMSNRNLQFLQYLDAHVDVSAMVLMYHTNGTIMPSDEVISLFENFKLVEIYISMDDVEDAYEYQRFPTKWPDINASIESLYNNMPGNVMFKIEQTISLLNLHRLPKLGEWFDTSIIHENRSGDKSYLVDHYCRGVFGLANISDSHYEWIKQNHPDATHHCGNNNRTDNTNIYEHVSRQDALRNMDINTWFPEFLSFYE